MVGSRRGRLRNAALHDLSCDLPYNAHVYLAAQLSETNYVAVVLDMAADTVYVARAFDDTTPIAAGTVADAIAEVAEAGWRDGQPVSIREAETDNQVAEVPGCGTRTRSHDRT